MADAISEAPEAWVVLENNPAVLNHLAHSIGLSPSLSFHDVYSLSDPDLLSLIPRPVHALCAIVPLTPAWKASREAEDAALFQGPCDDKPGDTGSQDQEHHQEQEPPVIFFKQTIPHTCGLIALLHCSLNNPLVRSHVLPGSELDRILQAAAAARSLSPTSRGEILEKSQVLRTAHEEAAQLGDSAAPVASGDGRLGQHFIAFVRGSDGHVYELEGSRRGPIDRGEMRAGEDMLSERVLALGLGRLMELERERGGGDLRFCCTALAATE